MTTLSMGEVHCLLSDLIRDRDRFSLSISIKNKQTTTKKKTNCKNSWHTDVNIKTGESSVQVTLVLTTNMFSGSLCGENIPD